MKKIYLALLSIFLLSACSSSTLELQKNGEGLTEVDIQIDGAATPYYAPLYLAQEKGYFKEAGLHVNFYYASAAEIVKNVGANNVMFGFPNADTVLLGRGNGVPVNIIHTTYQHGLGAIIYKNSSNIRTIQDLKGKTIAITSYGSPNYIQLKVILQQNGMSIEDVNVKVIGTGAIVNALVSDQVDAICFSKLRTYELRSSNIDVEQFLSNDYMPSYGNVVITSETFLKEHPEICKAFTSALNRGMQDIVDGNVEEAVNIARDHYTPNIAGSEQKYINIISQEFIGNLWISEDTKKYDFGYSNVHDYQNYIDLLQKNGLFQNVFPAEDLVVNLGDQS